MSDTDPVAHTHYRRGDPRVPLGPADWLSRNLRAITVLGVPAVCLIYLVYWLTTAASAQGERLETAIAMHERMRALDMARQDAYLYSICLNTSSDDVDRARCAIAHTFNGYQQTFGDVLAAPTVSPTTRPATRP